MMSPAAGGVMPPETPRGGGQACAEVPGGGFWRSGQRFPAQAVASRSSSSGARLGRS